VFVAVPLFEEGAGVSAGKCVGGLVGDHEEGSEVEQS
jgi:hypothetical protein